MRNSLVGWAFFTGEETDRPSRARRASKVGGVSPGRSGLRPARVGPRADVDVKLDPGDPRRIARADLGQPDLPHLPIFQDQPILPVGREARPAAEDAALVDLE